jgi:hypothetical protein
MLIFFQLQIGRWISGVGVGIRARFALLRRLARTTMSYVVVRLKKIKTEHTKRAAATLRVAPHGD